MGTYPQPVAPQLFDLVNDGTLGYYSANLGDRTNLTAISGANMTILSDWNPLTSFAIGNTGSLTSWRSLILLFPQQRNIEYLSFKTTHNSLDTLYSSSLIAISTNTTNGVDGTWNTVTTDLSSGYRIAEYQLYAPVAFTQNNVKGIEFRIGSNTSNNLNWHNINIWGSYTRNTGLVYWDGTNDQIMDNGNFDFGDTLPSSAVVREFRVKNAYTQTANTITVSAPAGYANTGSIRSGLEFSDDGTNYASSVVISSLAAGAISTKLYVRRTASAGITQNQFGAASIMAVPASWS